MLNIKNEDRFIGLCLSDSYIIDQQLAIKSASHAYNYSTKEEGHIVKITRHLGQSRHEYQVLQELASIRGIPALLAGGEFMVKL